MKFIPTAAAGAFVFVICAAVGSTLPSASRIFPSHYDNVLGTSLDLKVVALNEAQAEKAEAAALSEIERERQILSAWDEGSEFRRWAETSGKPVRVSPDLFEVLGLFDEWRERTNGALDASAESVIRVWKQAEAERRLPTRIKIDAAVALVNQRHWSLDRNAQTATHESGAPIALNSFAKSFIVNRAAAAAMATGVRGVVVNIGGDLVVRGSWTEPVDIADPFSNTENGEPIARLSIHDLAVATSGNYRRGVEIGGRHYSHIVDPRTGMPADQIASATVVAPNAVDAGAMATAFSILQPAESKKLAASMGRGVEFLLVDLRGVRTESAGWSKLAALPAVRAAALSPMTAAAAADNSTWDPSMELVLEVEIKQPSGFAKRPYLAAWIEDKDKFPVRTIALWFDRDRWLPELRAWSHDDRLRSMAEGTQIARSVSSATRAAGKYTIAWDGKDNAGKLVKAGTYTVLLEASREHGPYQIMRSELEVNAAPKQISMTGNTDIATATLEYRRTAKH